MQLAGGSKVDWGLGPPWCFAPRGPLCHGGLGRPNTANSRVSGGERGAERFLLQQCVRTFLGLLSVSSLLRFLEVLNGQFFSCFSSGSVNRFKMFWQRGSHVVRTQWHVSKSMARLATARAAGVYPSRRFHDTAHLRVVKPVLLADIGEGTNEIPIFLPR